MGTVTDPAGLFVTLIDDEWDETTGGTKPHVSQEWYSETPETVMDSDRMKVVRIITIKELSTTHTPASPSLEEVAGMLQIDLWAEDRTNVTEMRDEVKRILRANASDPVTGVCYAFISDWTDTSRLDASDQLQRLTATLEILYEEE